MSNFAGFSKRMKVRGDQIEKGVNRTVRKVALAVDQAVVLATPVDTGRARSNWQVSIVSPITTTRSAYSPGSKLGLGESANANAAIEHAKQKIRARTLGQEIHITNNLHYIKDLNDGSSAQALPGFVEAAVLAGAAVVRGAKVTVK